MKAVAVILVALVASAVGMPNLKRSPHLRIVGGEEATSNDQFPYQVSFQYLNSHFCGGSILNSEWIITAAHCAEGGSDADHSILAGAITFNDPNMQRHNVLRRVIHENYDGWDLFNDIALVHISPPLNMDETRAAVTLPPSMSDSSGDSIVTGWGALTEGGGLPSTLNWVSVPVITNEECSAAYGPSYPVADHMICAGLPEGGKDSCQGDSGGPMVCTQAGVSYQCGIVSWGIGCARPGYPGVYTRVSHFIDWISENAQ